MNKKEETKRVLKVTELVMEINEKTAHHAFLRINPHVKSADITIHYGGWAAKEGDPDIFLYIYYDDEKQYNNAIKEIEKIKKGEG